MTRRQVSGCPARSACARRLFGVLGLLLLLLAAGTALGPACVTPPAILPAGRPDLDLTDYPPGTERVEVAAGPGRRLVGVFVAAGTDAPVVLVLPGSLESVTTGALRAQTVRLAHPGETVGGGLDIFTTSSATAAEFSARLELGWAGNPCSYSLSFDGLGVGLSSELGGRTLALSWRLFEELADLGFSSLFVDYGGVGASSGERDAAALEADARAAFDEAVRRAGGDPARVGVRGSSLGALAAASLLGGPSPPRAAVFVAPVRGETVVRHFARWGNLPWWQQLALPWLAAVTDVDLLDVLARGHPHVLVVLPERDALLPDDERERLRMAAERGGAHLIVHEPGHESLVIAARGLLPGEAEFWRAAFPGHPAREQRVAAALAADEGVRLSAEQRARLAEIASRHRFAAGALGLLLASRDDGLSVAARLSPWLSRLPSARWTALDGEQAAALVDLTDPDGELPVEGLAALAPLLAGMPRHGLSALLEALPLGPGALTVRSDLLTAGVTVRVDGADTRLGFELRVDRQGAHVSGPEGLALWLLHGSIAAEQAAGLPQDAALRRAARLLVKAWGLPEPPPAHETP